MTQHGTPEGFRLHKRLEHQPCSSCEAAMAALLDRVRQFRGAVVAATPPQPARPPFTRVMLAKRKELAAARRTPPPALPPVKIPATRCTGLESWMPSAPRSKLKAFREAGWTAQLTRAAGPRIAANGTVPAGKECVYTVALAARRGAERVVMVWEHGDGKWKLDDAVHNRRGVIKSTDLKEILNGRP